MRRKIGVMLILFGLLFAGWNGYIWLLEAAAGSEPIAENDIIETSETENREKESAEDSPFSAEKTDPAIPQEFLNGKDELNFTKATAVEEPKQRDYKEYERGEKIGWLLIPSLDMKYPMYWGTDDETLTQGVGYHVGKFTTPPDGEQHTVLSGHRDTVFRELGELKEGDKMYVQFEGVQYEYQIQRTWVTDAKDRTVIVKKEEPTLTLTTCYPFTFIGAAPDRYIIEAALVNKTDMKS